MEGSRRQQILFYRQPRQNRRHPGLEQACDSGRLAQGTPPKFEEHGSDPDRKSRKDTDWVPLEISYAIDECDIPIIAAYPGYQYINRPDMLSSVWPKALADRIASQTAHVIHLPFSREPLHDAIDQFDFQHFPLGGGFGIYSDSAYRSWGLM